MARSVGWAAGGGGAVSRFGWGRGGGGGGAGGGAPPPGSRLAGREWGKASSARGGQVDMQVGSGDGPLGRSSL
jgi:hypothetical protein